MAGQYKTRCPHCGAQFKISDDHLGQARGAVRCGSCLRIFQATDHLVDPPADPPAEDQWRNALDADAEAITTPDAQESAKDDAGESVHESSDRYGDEHGTDHEGGSLGGSQLSDSFLSLDGDSDDQGLGENFSDMAGAGRVSHNDGTDEAWAEALLQDLEDEAEPESTSLREPVKTDPPEVTEDDDHLDFLGATPSSRDVANERLDYTAHYDPRYRLKTLFQWGAFSILALLALAGQYAFFHFDDLARSPRWRPLYAQACHYLGCRLPLRSDITTLRGANLVVRSDPDYRNALMVDALLYNEGQWPQPFPVLELTFNDLKGNVVASRRFLPSEYLHGQGAGMAAMPVDTPIHVAVRIVDPGDQAVSYNLRLLPARHTASRVSQAP